MYDEEVKILALTNDEIEVLKETLSNRLESCFSLGEQITVEGLIDKLN